MVAKKKKLGVQKKEEEAYYVGISSPNELRRSLLESSKVVIQLLKANEILKQTRKQKAELSEKLKDDVRVINKLITKLKSELPKTKFAASLSRAKPKKEEPAPKVQIVKMVGPKEEAPKPQPKPVARVPALKAESKLKPKPLSELDKLESDLSSIESKMKSL